MELMSGLVWLGVLLCLLSRDYVPLLARWGVSAVRLRGKTLNIHCCFWLAVTTPPAAAAKE